MHGLLGEMHRLALDQKQAALVVGQALADQAFAAWLQKSYAIFRGRLLSWETLAPRANPDAQATEAASHTAAQAWARQLAVIARTCLHQAMDRARSEVMQKA